MVERRVEGKEMFVIPVCHFWWESDGLWT